MCSAPDSYEQLLWRHYQKTVGVVAHSYNPGTWATGSVCLCLSLPLLPPSHPYFFLFRGVRYNIPTFMELEEVQSEFLQTEFCFPQTRIGI